MVLSVPVPSSSVNCNSFFDFGTATHSLTFTARKSDLLNVSKSTNSSNKGSTFTLEKSIFSDSVFTFFSGASEAVLFTSFFLFTPSKDFIVGKRSTSLIAAESVSSIHILSIPNPIPPVGGIPISSAFMKSSSVCVRFFVALSKELFLCLETFSLVDRVVQLGVCVRHFPSVHEELETLYIVRILRFLLGERRNLNRVIHYKGRLEQMLFYKFLEEQIQNIALLVSFFKFYVDAP